MNGQLDLDAAISLSAMPLAGAIGSNALGGGTSMVAHGFVQSMVTGKCLYAQRVRASRILHAWQIDEAPPHHNHCPAPPSCAVGLGPSPCV